MTGARDPPFQDLRGTRQGLVIELDGGEGPYRTTDSITHSIDPPGKARGDNEPTNVSAQAGNASAVVTWTPGSNDGNPITRYIVTPYAASVAQTPQTFPSTATSQTTTGLTNRACYILTVSAINAAGPGQGSAGSAPVTPSSLLGAPSSVAATPYNTGIGVAWTSPASGGSPITGYVITPYVGGPLASLTPWPTRKA